MAERLRHLLGRASSKQAEEHAAALAESLRTALQRIQVLERRLDAVSTTAQAARAEAQKCPPLYMIELELQETRDERDAACREAKVAVSMRNFAEERLLEAKSWMQEEHANLRTRVLEMKGKLSASEVEKARLRKIVYFLEATLKESGIDLQKTEEAKAAERLAEERERQKAEEERLNAESAVQATLNSWQTRTHKATSTIGQLSESLQLEIARVQQMKQRVAQAERERDAALEWAKEADANVRADVEAEFMRTQWSSFESELKRAAAARSIVVADKERIETELESLRNRLRQSKGLPHIGVQWALWGNRGTQSPAIPRASRNNVAAPGSGSAHDATSQGGQKTLSKSHSTPTLGSRQSGHTPMRPKR